MTINDASTNRLDHALVAGDLYRDVHKGIRTELFTLTAFAGSLDPSNRTRRADAATRVAQVGDFLATHAKHEDASVHPDLEVHLPALAETIAKDHATTDARLPTLRDMAASAVEA